jgi:hypothetical protein
MTDCLPWQRYVHRKTVRQPDGSLVLPADLDARWERQIARHTPSSPSRKKRVIASIVRGFARTECPSVIIHSLFPLGTNCGASDPDLHPMMVTGQRR